VERIHNLSYASEVLLSPLGSLYPLAWCPPSPSEFLHRLPISVVSDGTISIFENPVFSWEQAPL